MAKFKVKYSIQEFEFCDDGSELFISQMDTEEKDYDFEDLKIKISKLVFEYDERIRYFESCFKSEKIFEKYHNLTFDQLYKTLISAESSYKLLFSDVTYKKEVCFSKKELDEYILNLTNDFFIKNKEKLRLKYQEFHNFKQSKIIIFESLANIKKELNKFDNYHKQEVLKIQELISEIKNTTNYIDSLKNKF